jgi:hypothetical protein
MPQYFPCYRIRVLVMMMEFSYDKLEQGSMPFATIVRMCVRRQAESGTAYCACECHSSRELDPAPILACSCLKASPEVVRRR